MALINRVNRNGLFDRINKNDNDENWLNKDNLGKDSFNDFH